MNRFYSIITTFTALLLSYFLIKFINIYNPTINSSIANLPTKISFWIFIALTIMVIVGLLFFKNWIYSKRKKLLLSFSILLFGILTVEATLRLIDNAPLRFSPHPYLNYVGTPNYRSPDGLNMHNSLGLRGPEIKTPKPYGRIRIAVLGGSTTYEDFVKDWKKDFARRLEYELRQSFPNKDIEVINAGLPGWDSWESLVNLEFRLLDLELDWIIVYIGTNDVHARLVRPDAYKADNSGNKKQWEHKLCTEITCLKIVQRITGLDFFNFDIFAPTNALYPKANGYNGVLGMTPMEALAQNPPIYSERNLRNIIAIASEHGIDVLLATWAWSNKFNDYASSPHYEKGFRDQNETIKKVAKLKNVPLYDFASEMPIDKKYWGDGRHNNEEGISLKAKLFANFILQNNILKSRE